MILLINSLLTEFVEHEVFFLSTFNKDVVIVHKGLEGLLHYSLILRRRAVGHILWDASFLLNIDDIGRNITERSISFL